MKSPDSCGSHGYALPLVLVVIAVFLIYAGESAARVTREVRVIKTGQNADLAFYAAEAGFNRVRARMIKQGAQSDVLALNGRTDNLTLDDGSPGGSYTLSVSWNSTDSTYYVESVGTFGAEPFAARRLVRGTLHDDGAKSAKNPDRKITATYSP